MYKAAIREPGEEGQHYKQRTSTSLKFSQHRSTVITKIKTTAINLLYLRIGFKKQTHPNTPTTVIRAVTEEVGIHMERGGGRERGEKVSQDLPLIQVSSAMVRHRRKPETDEILSNTQSGIEEAELATATQRRVSRGSRAKTRGSLER